MKLKVNDIVKSIDGANDGHYGVVINIPSLYHPIIKFVDVEFSSTEKNYSKIQIKNVNHLQLVGRVIKWKSKSKNIIPDIPKNSLE